MKFAFFSIDGHGLPIAHKLQLEGNRVEVGIVSDWSKTASKTHKEDAESKKRRMSLFDGILKKQDADELLAKLLALQDKSDWFVVCDFNYLYPYADKLRDAGFKGFLAHKSDHKLEENRQKAKEIVEMKYPNLKTAEHHDFKKVDEGIKFLQENSDMSYVLKGFDEEAPTVVPKINNPEINHLCLIDALQRNKLKFESKGFMLEERIPDLIEFTPEAIAFDGELLGVNVDIELKDIGAGETGFQSGCAGDLCFWQELDGFCYENFLKPLEKYMLRPNELTIWDAAVAYSPSKQEFYFLEFCANRWGFNSIFTELSTLGSVTEYFNKIVNKEPLYTASTKKYGASVRLFNLIDDKAHPDQVLAESYMYYKPENMQVWPWDVKLMKDTYVSAGFDKNLAVMTGSDDDPEQAARKAYSPWGIDFYWDRALYRPIEDWLSLSYPTALLNRLNFGKMEGWFD